MKRLLLGAAAAMISLSVAAQQVPCVPVERLHSVMSASGFAPLHAGLVADTAIVAHWVNIDRDQMMVTVVTTAEPTVACVMMQMTIVGFHRETMTRMLESQR